MADRVFSREVSGALKQAYADIIPPDRLWRRVGATPVEDSVAAEPVIPATRGPAHRSTRRWNLVSAAAVIAVIAGVAVLETQGSSSQRVATSHPIPARDLVARCDAPSSQFVLVQQLSAGRAYSYTHFVRVGPRTVPEYSMYFSHGAPGRGTLCVSAQASSDDVAVHPILAAATAGSGSIAYVAAAYDLPFGAVRPGVARVTVQVQGDSSAPETYSTTNPDRYRQLRPIGSGWHVFNVEAGIGTGAAVLLIRAYDAHGRTLGNVHLPVDDGARPSRSPSN